MRLEIEIKRNASPRVGRYVRNLTRRDANEEMIAGGVEKTRNVKRIFLTRVIKTKQTNRKNSAPFSINGAKCWETLLHFFLVQKGNTLCFL